MGKSREENFLGFRYSVIFRKFVLFIFLALFSGIFGVSLCVIILSRYENENKYIDHASVKGEVEKFKIESRNYEVEGFGEVEYLCTGSCYCELKDRRGLVAGGARVSKQISVFLVAVTSLFAYRIAKKQFRDECVEMLKEECDDVNSIQSEVDECADEYEQEEEKEGGGDEDVCSITDAIFGRRSIRDYTDDRVPKETVKNIVDVGNFAPSGKNAQPLRYYVCDDEAILRDISDVCLTNIGENPSRNIFYNAPVVIFITWKNGVIGDEMLDAGVAMQNMQLYAHSLGIGSACIGYTKHCSDYIAEVIGFGEGEVYACALILGYPEPSRKVKVPTRKKAKINWGRSQYEDDD